MKQWIWLLIGIAILAGRNIMYGFVIKEGVYGTLHPVMEPALDAVRRIWQTHGLNRPVITSIEDGQHMATSKHYQGLAFDIRLNDINPQLHPTLILEVRQMLSTAFDVVHENHGTAHDHLHIEYDPT